MTHDDLSTVMAPSPAATEQVGIEIESGLVTPETGRATPYRGENGTLAVLETLLEEWGGERLEDAGLLTGIRLEDGTQITLEHGGQVEYSSAPAPNLQSAVDDARNTLQRLAELVGRFGLALLPGANLPFDDPSTMNWVPSTRGALMRDFFQRLGTAGSGAPQIMTTSLSTQVHVDCLNPQDFTRKLRMHTAAAPVVAALFVNSPLQAGRSNGLLSHRSDAWLRMDPRRCGTLPPALRPDVSVEDVIDWALHVPMLYHRSADGRYRAAPDRPFATVLDKGFDDGTMPTMHDWTAHLSQIWTHVHVRRTLELRGADGPHHHHIPAVPALWVGLSYHAPSRDAAWNLLSHYTVRDHDDALHNLPRQGLRTKLGNDRVHDLATELVRLARQGLTARVAAGLEPTQVVDHLDPLDEILTTGRTFAEQTLERWDTDLRQDPQRYVQAFRV
ncbi:MULTISPECIES: glutamate-cysteine ligase family protein [unclassified Streptomyces]|uniref:glutamate-cysteine ligase family protein n=1 Tax=unclassified Streptomyces TaxID=2593676 RepID=UPI00382479E9